MKKLHEFMAKIKILADAMAAAGNFDVRPAVTEIFAEIAAAEKATDNAVGRVIEMNDRIVELERHNAQLIKDCENASSSIRAHENNHVLLAEEQNKLCTMINELNMKLKAGERNFSEKIVKIGELNAQLEYQSKMIGERDERIKSLLGDRDRQAEMIGRLESKTDRLSTRAKEIATAFDVLESQSGATIHEMGNLIDDYAALVVSFREMPFVCFADDPFAALAAIVKADIDKAPIDWKQWPGVI